MWLPSLAHLDSGSDEEKVVAVATAKLLADSPALQANRPLWEGVRDGMGKKLSGEEAHTGNGNTGGTASAASEEEEEDIEESQVGGLVFESSSRIRRTSVGIFGSGMDVGVQVRSREWAGNLFALWWFGLDAVCVSLLWLNHHGVCNNNELALHATLPNKGTLVVWTIWPCSWLQQPCRPICP